MMIRQTTIFQYIVGHLMEHYSRVLGGPLFSDLVLQRQKQLWAEDELNVHNTAECKDTIVAATSGIEDWKCCPRWQRKVSNKLNAKRFAELNGVSVSPLFWYGVNPTLIPFDELPSDFVIKTSTGWSSREIMIVSSGRNLLDARAVTRDQIREHYSSLMKKPLYKDGVIVIEKLLRGVDGKPFPLDFKCHAFGGLVAFIQVIDRRNDSQIWYTRDWRPLSSIMRLTLRRGPHIPYSKEIQELIHKAEILASAYEYPFVRVDMYLGEDGPLFGEFTHSPTTGRTRLMYTPFANRTMGRLWLDRIARS